MSAKKFLASAFAVMLAAAAVVALVPPRLTQAAPPQQDNNPEQRTVTVTGFGTAYGSPDIVMLGLGVESSNSDISVAMEDVTQRMNQVIDLLQLEGVDSKDIRTEHFSIYQDYYGGPMPEGQRPEPVYRVSTGLNVTLRDTSQVGDLLSKAVAAGANLVNYVNFDIEDRGALQADARANAVADARDRAEQLAGILGLTVGEALQVTEGTENYLGPQARGMGGGGGVAMEAVPIQEGQLSVQVPVTITFQLVPAS